MSNQTCPFCGKSPVQQLLTSYLCYNAECAYYDEAYAADLFDETGDTIFIFPSPADIQYETYEWKGGGEKMTRITPPAPPPAPHPSTADFSTKTDEEEAALDLISGSGYTVTTTPSSGFVWAVPQDYNTYTYAPTTGYLTTGTAWSLTTSTSTTTDDSTYDHDFEDINELKDHYDGQIEDLIDDIDDNEARIKELEKTIASLAATVASLTVAIQKPQISNIN